MRCACFVELRDLEKCRVSLYDQMIFCRSMTIHDFNSEKIAEQMTLLDLELFQKIEVIQRCFVLVWWLFRFDVKQATITAVFCVRT